MTDIAVSGLNKYFGETQVLKGITFELFTGQHVGLIGRNGAGKTTLFKILCGQYDYEEGSVFIPSSKKVGVLAQIPVFPEGTTVEGVLRSAFAHLDQIRSEMKQIESRMAAGSDDRATLSRYGELGSAYESEGGYECDTALVKVANGLHIDADMLARPFALLSGGEQTRVNLARMILSGTDIMLLDEPTNHLDMPSVEWLEEYLATCRCTVIIISHDRYFLDRTVTRILELEDLRCTLYEGNYTYYADEKARLLAEQQVKYEHEQREISRLEFTAERMHGWGMGNKKLQKRAFAMDKRVERLRQNAVEKVRGSKAMRGGFKESETSGNDVCFIKELAKGYNDRTLFHGADLEIKKGENVAIIGENGTGKSTLLRIMLGEEPADYGRVRWGANIKFAFLPQLVSFPNDRANLMETVRDELNVTEPMARNRLAAYHFFGEDVFKPISALSGGEKSRLKLCILMYSEINLLILDEPTNHLDIPSREWMEDALSGFDGTILFVSHDRYFIDLFATRVWQFENEGITEFKGTYREYQAHLAKLAAAKALQKETASQPSVPHAAHPRKSDGKANAKEMQKRLAVLEREIAAAEAKLSEITLGMENCGSDHVALSRLMDEETECRQALDGLYDEWTGLADGSPE